MSKVEGKRHKESLLGGITEKTVILSGALTVRTGVITVLANWWIAFVVHAKNTATEWVHRPIVRGSKIQIPVLIFFARGTGNRIETALARGITFQAHLLRSIGIVVPFLTFTEANPILSMHI